MNARRVFLSVLVLALLAAVAVGLSQAQGSRLGDGGPPEGANSPEGANRPEALAYGGIPIQGRLTDAGGKPVPDGDYTLTFRLYEDPYGGVTLCEDMDGPPDDPLNPVEVSGGLFSAFVDSCSAEVLDGRWLYLGLEVGDDGEMSPRQIIGTVPYARSLRPEAWIRGDVPGGPVLWLYNDASGESSRGLIAITAGSDALYGYSNTGTGVRGCSFSGWAGYFEGDVGQSRYSDGLLKAAVYANCRDSGSSITRSFNLVEGTITIADGSAAGKCILDFGFDIGDRYFSATAFPSDGGSARGLSCTWGADDEKLDCFRWKADGSGANGEIMVAIY